MDAVVVIAHTEVVDLGWLFRTHSKQDKQKMLNKIGKQKGFRLYRRFYLLLFPVHKRKLMLFRCACCYSCDTVDHAAARLLLLVMVVLVVPTVYTRRGIRRVWDFSLHAIMTDPLIVVYFLTSYSSSNAPFTSAVHTFPLSSIQFQMYRLSVQL